MRLRLILNWGLTMTNDILRMGLKPCPRCGGFGTFDGRIPRNNSRPCTHCEGQRYVPVAEATEAPAAPASTVVEELAAARAEIERLKIGLERIASHAQLGYRDLWASFADGSISHYNGDNWLDLERYARALLEGKD